MINDEWKWCRIGGVGGRDEVMGGVSGVGGVAGERMGMSSGDVI